MLACTYTRCTLMHDWPAYANAPLAIIGTAVAMSASSQTITAALPPSSSVTFCFIACDLIGQPTLGLPVKLTILMRGSLMGLGASSFEQGTMLICPGVMPAASSTSPSNTAVSGVRGAGLSTIVFPVAMQGATLWATRLS